MKRLRRVLGPLATLWLCCQVTTATFTPIVLWATSTSADVEQCTCPHRADADCPMHPKTAPGSKVCLIRGLPDSATVTLRSLLSLTGLLPGSQHAFADRPTQSPEIIDILMVTERPLPPDPPPPRV
jgi:hypothetical protein